jgi:hypothetical protein
MSSKWSKNSAVQQPPPVCRKPPGDLPTASPPIQNRTLQAYVRSFFAGTPTNFNVAALIELNPTDPDTTWAGISNQGTFNLELELFALPPYNNFRVELTALVGPAPVRDFIWNNIMQEHLFTFRLPYLTSDTNPQIELWTCQVTN